MGETIGQSRLQFNGSLRIEAREERLSSHAGAVVMREYLERTGIVDWLDERVEDPRRQDLITHPMRELLLTSVLLRAQGCEDQDDADRLRNDPALRLAVSTRKGDASLRAAPDDLAESSGKARVPDGLASQPTLSRLVFDLCSVENRKVLRHALTEQAIRRNQVTRGHRHQHLTIDVDDLPVYVEGEQPGSAFHPYYGARIYRPLIVSVAETGDLLDVVLRDGTAHSSEGFADLLPSVLDRIEGELCLSASVRIDAGFQGEDVYSALEGRNTPYVGRLRDNSVLDRLAKPHMTRPVGRPPKEPRVWFHEYEYRAAEWSRTRRAVLVVLERPGKLFVEHFWLVTSWSPEERPAEALLELYRQRGTAEGHMGEWVNTLRPRLSSADRAKSHYRGEPVKQPIGWGYPYQQNEVTLLLSAIAYNAMHGVRTLVEKETREGWSLQRLRERMLLVASRFLTKARQVTMVLGEGAASLWKPLLRSLEKIRLPAGSRSGGVVGIAPAPVALV